ncbi:MAG: hypothetical protein HFJ50_07710 [Clostridia bacterium]|jgi:hypothetical protein|nr:hypothetical protein [Clostridia bacterium]
MIKKSIITTFIFSIIALFSIPVFAQDIAKGAENTLNGIKGGVQNMTTDASHAMEGVKNGAKNVVDDVTSSSQTRTDTTDYTATRTSSTGMTNASAHNTTLVWTVLSITGLVILALVWYYGRQTTSRR